MPLVPLLIMCLLLPYGLFRANTNAIVMKKLLFFTPHVPLVPHQVLLALRRVQPEQSHPAHVRHHVLQAGPHLVDGHRRRRRAGARAHRVFFSCIIGGGEASWQW